MVLITAPQESTRVTITVTAADDNPFRLISNDLIYYDLTVWVLTNPAYIGSGNIIAAPLQAGDIYYDRNGNLNELWFKNYTAGSNTVIVATATIPNKTAKQVLGYPV